VAATNRGGDRGQPPLHRQAANLYLREDVIIGRILAQLHTRTSRGADIREDIARLQQSRNAAERRR
jgi:hypothetical protein